MLMVPPTRQRLEAGFDWLLRVSAADVNDVVSFLPRTLLDLTW